MVQLQRLLGADAPRVYAKLEFLNPAGSVKDRAARYVIERGVEDGVLKPDTHVVESTSGNFGVALAMMASIYDLRLTLVVDPNITASNLTILKSYGATVDMVDVPSPQCGYLEARIERVRQLLAADPSSVWINQYASSRCDRRRRRRGRARGWAWRARPSRPGSGSGPAAPTGRAPVPAMRESPARRR